MTNHIRYLLAFASLIASVACFAGERSMRDRNDAIIVRAVQRMKEVDYSNDEHVQQAIQRHVAKHVGTAEYVELAARFRPDGMIENLMQLVLSDQPDAVRVRALGLMLSVDEGRKAVRQMLAGDSADQGKSVATALALLGNRRSQMLLAEVVSDPGRPFDQRKNAVVAMALNQNTSKSLLAIAQQNRLPADTRLLAGGLLSRSRNSEVRTTAIELFPQPQQKDRKPLPPLDQLAEMKGDAANGAKLFSGVATCGNCHPVAGQGKQVGPDLSEIGSKLSREAMLTSILDPNAGISHNYESYVVLTNDGQVINGLKISNTEDQVVIRTAEAIDHEIATADIESMKQSETSIMPENLHQTIDQQGLIDVVEYMMTLTSK
jgi:putative heme-binding domain-containing protein